MEVLLDSNEVLPKGALEVFRGCFPIYLLGEGPGWPPKSPNFLSTTKMVQAQKVKQVEQLKASKPCKQPPLQNCRFTEGPNKNQQQQTTRNSPFLEIPCGWGWGGGADPRSWEGSSWSCAAKPSKRVASCEQRAAMLWGSDSATR